MFVLQAGVSDLETESVALFEAVTAAVTAMGGWLIESGVTAAEGRGFARLMGSRARGDMPWEQCNERAMRYVEGGDYDTLAVKTPYAMLARAGYPCWALGGHVVSIDLFNPAGELFIPSDEGVRMWGLHSHSSRFLIPSPVLATLVGAAASALKATCGFGGAWVKSCVFAYRFAEWSEDRFLKPLAETVRLGDLGFAYMILDAKRWAGIDKTLSDAAFAVTGRGTTGTIPCFEPVGRAGEYLLIRAGSAYPDADDRIGRRVSSALGRIYAADAILRRPEDWS